MKQQIGKVVALILILVSAPAFGVLTATVDRTQITELDLVTYTLRLEDATASESPNFSAVERDFDIVQQSGPNRSSRITIVNGRQEAESSTEWVLTLRPRRKGTLQIPAIRVGSEVAQPVSINVSEASAATRRRMDQFVFFETEVDKEQSYVQEQILYTVKLFYVDSISGDFPPPPQLDNAIIETIENEKRYESIVSNRRFFVLEKQYAIYPQRSGLLELPRETFTGTRGRGSFFSARERVTAVSEGHRIRVEPRPVQFTGTDWLPAEDLTLTESWSTNFPNFTVGEPVNRTLTIQATGIASSLLPPFEAAEIEGAKTYQDPPVMTDEATANGIVASMTATIGIVPTQEGTLEIPEIRIPWWNTVTGQQEEAVLPARTVQVAPGSAPTVRVPQVQDAPQAVTGSSTASGSTASSVWLYIAIVLAALWLITLWQFVVVRQRLSALTAAPDENPESTGASEREAWSQLQAACSANDAELARRTLFTWAKLRYPDIHSLADLVRLTGHPGLRDELAAMETALYAPSASAVWNGSTLASIAGEIRAHTDRTTRDGKRDGRLARTLNPS